MKTMSSIIAASLLPIVAFLTLRTGVMAQPPKNDLPNAAAAALSTEDDKAVRKVVTGFEDAWNAHDMKAMGKLFRGDAEFINVVGMHWHGRKEIETAFTAFHETIFKTNQMKTDTVETRLLGNGYAVAVATITQDGFTTPDGHTQPRAQCRETFVLVKGEDGWKIAHGHNVGVNAEAAKNDPVKRPKK